MMALPTRYLCPSCKENHMYVEGRLCLTCNPPADVDYFADWPDEPDDGWTDDEEEALIWDGICPECGAELDVCPHGAPWFDMEDYDG